MTRRGLAVRCVAPIVLLLGTPIVVPAQVIGVQDLLRLEDFEHDTGSNVAPIYHGWEGNADGTASMYFGYLNRNWKEDADIPLGPNNFFDPAPQDRGQPAHFFPRLHRSVFKIDVPKTFKGELVWTLTMRGRTDRVKATLAADAEINFMNVPQQRNRPPRVTSLEPGQTIALSQAATLNVAVVDDGLPTPAGLRVEWVKYRGPGAVTFQEAVPKIQGGMAVTTATFSEPGVYMLQVWADDGSRSSPTSDCCWVTAVTTVTVTPTVQNPKPQ